MYLQACRKMHGTFLYRAAMIRLFSGLINSAQYDVATLLRKDRKTEVLKN